MTEKKVIRAIKTELTRITGWVRDGQIREELAVAKETALLGLAISLGIREKIKTD